MQRITVLPKYPVGGVVDLSFKNGGLPNRIYIESASWAEGDTEWKYSAKSEMDNGQITFAESTIRKYEANQRSRVGKMQLIIDRYEDGWRYCGNYDKESAIANGNMIAGKTNVRNVKLFPALDINGILLPNEFGIWIRYVNTINADGSQVPNDFECIEIK